MAADQKLQEVFPLAFHELESLSAPPGGRPSTSKMLGLIAGIWIEGHQHLLAAFPDMTLATAFGDYAHRFKLTEVQPIDAPISAVVMHNFWNHGGRLLRKYRAVYQLDAIQSWSLCDGLLHNLTMRIGGPQDTANFFYMMLQRQLMLLATVDGIFPLRTADIPLRPWLRLLAEKMAEAISRMPALEFDPSTSTSSLKNYREASGETAESKQIRKSALADVLSEASQACPLDSRTEGDFDDEDLPLPKLDIDLTQKISTEIDSILKIGTQNGPDTAAMALGHIAGREIGRATREGTAREAMLQRLREIAQSELATRNGVS